MLKSGWDELKIMKELGMTLEEVQRLIGLKGIASEIQGVPYSIDGKTNIIMRLGRKYNME